MRYLKLDKALLFPTYLWLQKGVRDFLILLRFLVIDKPCVCEWVETSSFFILANNLRSKEDKKISKHPFADIGK